jgi:hypothetical protein
MNKDRGYNEPQMNVRVYLNVPFCDKEDAKELGCNWDFARKKWYSIDSDYGRSNVTKCLELWGPGYKMIDGKEISIDEIHHNNRGYTSF